MKRAIIFLLSTWLPVAVSAQKTIAGLIRAEKNFAALSLANGVKQAFLQFADTNAVVFDKGKPVNAIATWSARPETGAVLDWHPDFSEISSAGDFGYTSGPWTYRPSPRDSILARGQYITIWYYNEKEGKWKFLVDLGTDNRPVEADRDPRIIIVSKDTGRSRRKAGFSDAEEAFIRLAAKDPQKAYATYLSSFHSILNRNGQLPAVSAADKDAVIRSTPSVITYRPDGWKMSAAGDMACVYGSLESNGIKENYLRIWRREQKGWRIALEVVRY